MLTQRPGLSAINTYNKNEVPSHNTRKHLDRHRDLLNIDFMMRTLIKNINFSVEPLVEKRKVVD